MVKKTAGALLLSLRIDRAAPVSIGTQLLSGLRETILSGALSAGERLPASRTLAKDLGLSRTTVIAAYDRLTAEGLTTSHVGAGTYVSDTLSDLRPRQASPAGQARPGHPRHSPAPRASNISQRLELASHGFVPRLQHKPRAFTTAMPAFDEFPLAQWSRHVAKQWRAQRYEVMGYSDPCGHFPLRRAIASHLKTNRAIDCDPQQIFVVCGAQQAFQLLGHILLDPGDKVWFENPGAIGARNALMATGARLVPLPVDIEGLDVAEGLRQAADFKLAFVTPAHQQPLGVSMSLRRRFALLQAADAANAYVIEDDFDGEFCYGGYPQPTLKSIDDTGRVIYVGTFSKSLFPALRLGYIVSPPALVDTLDQVTGAVLPGVPSNLQGVVADFMEQGRFATHLRHMRKIYCERHQVFLDASRRWLDGRLEVVPTDTGLHTIGRLAPDIDEAAITQAAEARGVTVAPIGSFCIAPIETRGLLLGFSGVAPPQLIQGVKTLAQAFEDIVKQARSA